MQHEANYHLPAAKENASQRLKSATIPLLYIVTKYSNKYYANSWCSVKFEQNTPHPLNRSIRFLNIEVIEIREQTRARYLTTALKLGNPAFWCHQTLSFKQPMDVPLEDVKRPLKRLLDSLHKAFSMATLFVVEPCTKQGWHIHAYFIFYGAAPFGEDRERNRQLFGQHVFKLWNRINGGSLCRRANKTTAYDNLDPTYFIKHLVALPRWKPKKRDSANWWGVRNRRLLKQNEAPLDAVLLAETMVKVRHNEIRAIEESKSASEVERDWKPDPLLECPHKNWFTPSQKKQPPLHEMQTADCLMLLLAG